MSKRDGASAPASGGKKAKVEDATPSSGKLGPYHLSSWQGDVELLEGENNKVLSPMVKL